MRDGLIKYLWSFSWTLLVLFFAYASFTKVLFTIDTHISDEYFQIQSSFFSMVINFGIILMIVFDVGDSEFHKNSFYWVIFSFVVIMLMHGHAENITGNNNNHYKLISLIGSSQTGLLLGGIFLMLTVQIKVLSKKFLDDIKLKNRNGIQI